uniref:Uncharacterized protein n=1 Tax=Syphacia muris TaxID=451379 RepID=A0A0N5AH86_9BILA
MILIRLHGKIDNASSSICLICALCSFCGYSFYNSQISCVVGKLELARLGACQECCDCRCKKKVNNAVNGRGRDRQPEADTAAAAAAAAATAAKEKFFCQRLITDRK